MSLSSIKKINFQPLGDRVVVKRQQQEEKLKGGIIIPESSKKPQETAHVVAVSHSYKDKQGHLIPSPVQVGELIMMDKYSGQDVKIDDEDYVILKFEDIIAIINP
ncbi:MAG: co-chaperone GroES [Rhabdochlamydiaceae bacterium]